MVSRYRAWDGSQAVEALAPEQMVTALADALLAGDINQALDRTLHRGFTGDDGERTEGLDHLRDRLRAERRSAEEALHDDHALRDLAEALAGAAGGDEHLDAEQSQLLDALASRPEVHARLLGALDVGSREAMSGALQRRSPLADRSALSLESVPSFAGQREDALRALNRLGELDDLEQRLRRIRKVDDIQEIDLDRVRTLLGDQAADHLGMLEASLQRFITSGYVRAEGRRVELSARALQIIGDRLLEVTLSRLAAQHAGDRLILQRGHHDLTGSTRQYEFGDPLALDLSRSVLQAVRRGAGTPVRIRATDFAIFEREDSVRSATHLAIDLSRSMGERGFLLTAKQLALALTTLVRTRFPRDSIFLSGFSETARPIAPQQLPRLTWDRFGFGTNMQDALRLARHQLAAHRGLQRTAILLTDGEPTAHRDRDDRIQFHHPPSEETLAHTYAEADRLRRDGIDLCVVVLSTQMQVVRFAETLVRRAAGELIVTNPEDLSSAIVLHYAARRSVRR